MDSMSEFVGHKDKDVGLFTVFDRIFTKRDAVRTAKRARAEGKQSSAQQLLHLVTANSQYDKLVEGKFVTNFAQSAHGTMRITSPKIPSGKHPTQIHR